MPDPTPTHRRCRHLKMDGVRCGRAIPIGHIHCYMHRFNRDPSFVVHHGKRRVPLLEDVASLQVTTTAAVHGLLNRSLDSKEVRTILYAVNAAAGLLRVDLAEKRWLAQTGQTRPEPVTDFAVVDHEHLAVEDPLPAEAASEPAASEPDTSRAATPPASKPCSTLDPADDFYSPQTFLEFDRTQRVPPTAPGTFDPLGSDWPCPYRFNFCKGPGYISACHYCAGHLRWDEVHPGEPDPGAPGPLPTIDVHWDMGLNRDKSAPPLPAPQLLPPAAEPRPVPTSGSTHSKPAPEIWTDLSAPFDPSIDSEEVWVHGLTPLPDPDPDPIPDPNLVSSLRAAAK